MVNGFPAISYSAASTTILKYVRATNANGSGVWGTPQTIGSGGIVARVYTSLAVVNGFPAISYYEGVPSFALKYVCALNVDGSGAWGTPLTIDAIGDVGLYTSLAVVNGFPAISYFDVTNSGLKYARFSSNGGELQYKIHWYAKKQ